jgi:hypothetical protein
MFDPKRENAKRMARRRFEAREVLDREKARKPCKDCGHKYHPCQIDVLRPNGGRKVPVARMLHLSIERIREEIDRCELVCSNCSRMRVYMRDRLRRSGPT